MIVFRCTLNCKLFYYLYNELSPLLIYPTYLNNYYTILFLVPLYLLKSSWLHVV